MRTYQMFGTALALAALAGCEPETEPVEEAGPPPGLPSLENAATTNPTSGEAVADEGIADEATEELSEEEEGV